MILFPISIIVVLVIAVTVVGSQAQARAKEAASAEAASAVLRERVLHLEREHTRVVLEYFNVETGPVFGKGPEWTPDDALALTAFLKTPSGIALAARFQAVAGNQCVTGCQDPMHTTYAAGNGNGWSEACQWFLKLSRVTGVQVATNDESAPEGETQLLERLAP